MDVIEKKLKDRKPYEKNPRKNDGAVDAVAHSISSFGFRVPLVVDSKGVIVCGHTRYKAAKKLKLDTVPCVIADDLTEEQIKAYRLADNKVAELADWDIDLLNEELDGIFDIDMSDFGFDLAEEEQEQEDFETRKKEFEERMASGELSEDSEEYQEFIEKFEQKKTTDDCYTPEPVYNAVMEFVEDRYKVSRHDFVRPFYPGGDYQAYKYKKTDIVVDNPPFSIIAEILKFYAENNVKFFLFAPHLTLMSGAATDTCTAVIVGVTVIDENGARVNTSFLTNLESEYVAITCPELYGKVKQAVEESKTTVELPKYSYPTALFTAPMGNYYSKHGVELKIKRSECVKVRELDAQKDMGKSIFGAGLLLSTAATERKAAAEKAAAEKAAAEKVAVHVFKLSDRELGIIAELDKNAEK